MCCHHCSSPAGWATTPQSPTSPSNFAGASAGALNTPIIQINYLGDQVNMPSLNVGSSCYIPSHPQATRTIQRASTIPGGSYASHSSVNAQFNDPAATVYSCGDMSRTPSIHICISTGACRHKHSGCKKDHLPGSRVKQLLDKLALIKTWRRNPESDGQSPKSSRARGWPWTSNSDIMSEHERRVDQHYVAQELKNNPPFYPAELFTDQAAELDGMGWLHSASGHAATGTTDSYDLYEVEGSSVAEMPSCEGAVELDGAVDMAATQCIVEPQRVDFARPPPAYNRVSMVSAISSSQASSGSESDRFWRFSQMSAVSDMSPYTPFSSRQTSQSEACEVYGSEEVYRHHAESLYLRVPEHPFTDGPLTDSPTVGDADSFPGLQDSTFAPTGPAAGFGTAADNMDFGFGDQPGMAPWQPQPPLSPNWPMQSVVELDSFHLEQVVHLPPLPALGSGLSEPFAAHLPAVPHDHPDRVTTLLEAHREAAMRMCHQSPATLKTYLQDVFEVMISWYLKEVNDPADFTAQFLNAGEGTAPTIHAARQAIHAIRTDCSSLTSQQLMSLAFLSFALLCLTLEGDSLLDAVKILRLQARSWIDSISSPGQKRLFEGFIDEQWLLADESLRTKVTSRRPRSLSTVAMPSLPYTDDLVVVVTEIFVQLIWPGWPSPDPGLAPGELAGHPTSFFLAEIPNQQDPPVPRHEAGDIPFSQYLVGAKEVDLPTPLPRLERRPPSHSRSLEHVVSAPEASGNAHTVFGCDGSDQRSIAPTKPKRGNSAGNLARKPTSTLPPTTLKRRPRRNRLGIPDQGPPYVCVEHQKTFMGKWAKGNYFRHLTHTKEHGCSPFVCPTCLADMARVDHFKQHMANMHNLNVLGRKGDYTFQEIQDAVLPEGCTVQSAVD